MLGAIGAAPLVISLPLPEPAPPTKEMEPFYLGAEERALPGARLEFEKDGRWYQAGQLLEINGPYIDQTPQQWTASASALVSAGDLELRLAGGSLDVAILGLIHRQEPVTFRLIYPSPNREYGSMWEFEAYVTDYKIDIPRADAGPMETMLSVVINGQPQFTTYDPGGAAT
jgi:hypothetical protein